MENTKIVIMSADDWEAVEWLMSVEVSNLVLGKGTKEQIDKIRDVLDRFRNNTFSK